MTSTSTPTIPADFRPWAGGECPVPRDMIVDIITRENGTTRLRACVFRWSHSSEADQHCYDIIAYKPDPRYVPPIDWQAKYEAAEKALLTVQNAAKTLAAAQGSELEHRRQNAKYDHKLRAEHESLIERDTIMTEELTTLRAKAEKLAAAINAMWEAEPIGSISEIGSIACAALAEWEGKP